MDSAHDTEREDHLRAEISARLQRVCSHLSEDQFAELVRDIADVTLKYEMRSGAAPPKPKPKRAD